MNNITKKWLTTGVLDGLINCEHRDMIAQKLEEVVQYFLTILHEPYTPENEEFAGILIPATRKVYDSVPVDRRPTPKWFVDDCLAYYQKNKDMIKELNSYIAQDGEREFTDLYCKDVIGRLYGNV